jgi:hypothetical protein
VKEEQDDLTLVYMFGYKNGKESMKAENERLRAALREIADGPRDADKSYVSLLHEIQSEARAALEGEKTKQSTPGYKHMTPETVQAIRDTCSTPASRVGKTQSEVFKEEDTP